MRLSMKYKRLYKKREIVSRIELNMLKVNSTDIGFGLLYLWLENYLWSISEVDQEGRGKTVIETPSNRIVE